MYIGNIVAEYRRENNITMQEFANKSGVSKGYISMLEKGKNPTSGKPITPSIYTYKMLADAMGLSLEELFQKTGNTRVLLNEASSQNLERTQREQEMVELFNAMPTETQDALIALAKQFLQRQENQ